MFKNKKIILIFFFIFIFFFLSYRNVFASFSVEYNGETLELPDLPDGLLENYFILSSGSSYRIYTSDYEFTYKESRGYLTLENGSCQYCTLFFGSWDDWAGSSGASGVSDINAVVYSNFDIKDSSGNVVFLSSPQQGEEAQVILAPVVAQVEMSQTLSETVKLLPLIIVVVVSFLGLRKALRMLFRVLRTS